jgi:hypothetical protein
MTSPSGFSSGGISSRALGGRRDTGVVGAASPAREANAS